MRYRQQLDSSDCGAACIAMLASHFGIIINIAKSNIKKINLNLNQKDQNLIK